MEWSFRLFVVVRLTVLREVIKLIYVTLNPTVGNFVSLGGVGFSEVPENWRSFKIYFWKKKSGLIKIMWRYKRLV